MIEARNLEKRYGDFSALDGVSFDCATAECFGVIGHTGAGKTTLLKCLAGLIQPTSGSLVIDGIDVLADPVALKARLGYLSEESRLYETMTVPDYLGFFGELYGGLARRRPRAGGLLDASARSRQQARCGSRRMKRKVAIARSLIHDPSLLAYDEPYVGLDPMTSRASPTTSPNSGRGARRSSSLPTTSSRSRPSATTSRSSRRGGARRSGQWTSSGTGSARRSTGSSSLSPPDGHRGWSWRRSPMARDTGWRRGRSRR